MTEHEKNAIRVRLRNTPHVLTLDQLRRFFQVAEQQSLGTLLWFALCTGMR
ncbi:hypothetical protein [Ktedonospora formicarum]|uniref:Uncharacterized protein n=1 Tax=Ktedonospora formicarum TaxID=2778364 RepID=A0A8J3IBM3_9CHLR|nr:hypothetical protein [Ktedonospora formicarum]GHO50963.1 hypothetical protein KSX_91260 [Ktedonospora formicarum]